MHINSMQGKSAGAVLRVENGDGNETSQDRLNEREWICNMSMHSPYCLDWEKFFITCMETPKKWRRLTVSVDYRHALEDSLEARLIDLPTVAEKSLHIYRAVRESLPEIDFSSTITNLKLETTVDDDVLHIHVCEDAREIICYPSISLFEHMRIPFLNEEELSLVSHLSGYVYKVSINGTVFVKKEIPGPGLVDEFLYQANGLHSVAGTGSVIQLKGLVTDASGV